MFNDYAICIYFKSGGGDGWMNQVSRQFSNMGLLVGLVLIKNKCSKQFNCEITANDLFS